MPRQRIHHSRVTYQVPEDFPERLERFKELSGLSWAEIARRLDIHLNGDEAIWGWAREEATGNLCLRSREAVQDKVGKLLAGLASRKDEVRRRCRTVLQSRAESLLRDPQPESPHPANAHPTLALV